MPSALLALALLALALLALSGTASDDGVTALRQLQALDQRVTTVGYRLATAAAGLCADSVPLAGVEVHDLSLYGGASRDDARRAFGLGDAPQVLAVAAGSPLARAGLEPGDALVAIGSAPVPGGAGLDRVERIDTALEAGARGGMLDLVIGHGGAQRTLHAALEKGCPSRFVVRVADSAEAEADGHYVEITSGYVELADNDDALALVLGHELAHNILGHRARLERQGVRYGIAQHFGRNARLIRETEIEADRLSVDLAARAGFDVTRAIAFRERQWRGLDQTLLRSPTHPSPRERLATLRAEYARIAGAQPGMP
jgi:hypothetical protein